MKMRSIILLLLFVFLGTTACLPAFAQQEPVTLESLSARVTDINQKIDQISQSQQDILKRLEDILAELDIVKIRARR